MNKENVIKGLHQHCECSLFDRCGECPYYETDFDSWGESKFKCRDKLLIDALALLKEHEELLRKLQKDKDKLCLEVSEWKHKFHDAPPKFVSQGVVDQICWERDTALSQLEQIGKGLGSKMDDIVALLKEQEEREQAICKEICDFIRKACSTDTEDDKDYVCYVIQNCFKHFCADGERK